METLYAHINAKIQKIKCNEVDLKIIQTRVSPENLNYEFVELCLTCKSTIIWTIVCGFEINDGNGGWSMEVRHLRGRARSCDPYRGVFGARLDEAQGHSGLRVFPW